MEYTIKNDMDNIPLYLEKDEEGKYHLTENETGDHYKTDILLEAMKVISNDGNGSREMPYLSIATKYRNLKLASFEYLPIAVELKESETTLNTSISVKGQDKCIDLDIGQYELSCPTPQIYCVDQELRAIVKRDKGRYLVASIKKEHNIDPKVGDTIYCYSSYSSSAYPEYTFKLVGEADVEKLLDNRDINPEKSDYFIAESLR